MKWSWHEDSIECVKGKPAISRMNVHLGKPFLSSRYWQGQGGEHFFKRHTQTHTHTIPRRPERFPEEGPRSPYNWLEGVWYGKHIICLRWKQSHWSSAFPRKEQAVLGVKEDDIKVQKYFHGADNCPWASRVGAGMQWFCVASGMRKDASELLDHHLWWELSWLLG